MRKKPDPTKHVESTNIIECVKLKVKIPIDLKSPWLKNVFLAKDLRFCIHDFNIIPPNYEL